VRAAVQTWVERHAKINDKMKPEETASHYDRVALWWQKQHMHSAYGVTALEKAIQFPENKSSALDIGCGSSGRFIDVLIRHGCDSGARVEAGDIISRPTFYREIQNRSHEIGQV
jgi:hypothetical protein